MTSEASTTTWETLVEQYRERAARDYARIEELRQRTEHWHDTADMLKRQRDQAEKERDALRKDAARLDWLESRKSYSISNLGGMYSISNLGGMACAHLWFTDGEDVRVTMSVTKPTIREAIDAAMEATP
jgi:hypothetical protein